MAQSGTVRNAAVTAVVPSGKRARSILDLSGTKLGDRPAFLEEKLRKMSGVIDVEINVFSNRITVEFDPSLITLEKIKASLAKRNGS
jgi:heavy-metal-associated domain-containing protein